MNKTTAESVQNKDTGLWPIRHAAIALYAWKAISREEFIELWEFVYGKE
jgi:hypothetical protein